MKAICIKKEKLYFIKTFLSLKKLPYNIILYNSILLFNFIFFIINKFIVFFINKILIIQKIKKKIIIYNF